MENYKLFNAPHNPKGRKVKTLALSFLMWGRPVFALALLSLFASCAAPEPGHFHEIKSLTAEEHLLLASTYEEKGEFEPALGHYKEAFKKGQRDAAAYFRAGNLSLKTKQPEYAAYFYQMAIKLDPSNSAFTITSAAIWRRRLDEAEASVAEAMKKTPEQYIYLDTLAVLR